MKKVLALVLAVVMVCTMALAAPIVIKPGDPVTNPDSPTTPYTVMNPGTTIALDLGTVNFYVKDGKFVPANNVVTVSFAKGAELVKSQGWVKVSKGIAGSYAGDKDTDGYQYQITFKSDLSKIADTKVADIQISAVSFKATGYNAVSILKAAKAEEYTSYAFGYEKNVITEVKEGENTIGVATDRINVVEKLSDKAGKEVSALEVTIDGMTYTLNKGTKFYAAAKAPEFTTKEVGNAITKATYENALNLPATVNYAKGVNADKVLKAYAKTTDGKVLSVAVTEKDGVMSFTVPALTTVILVEGTLNASGTTGTTTGGTTTNPGTGANDVVGVAAALAVVALVSGAAISLKK